MPSAGFETALLTLGQIQTHASEHFVPESGICKLLGHKMYVYLSLSLSLSLSHVSACMGREGTKGHIL